MVGGWVCGGGVDGGRLRRWFSSALTPALSLAGEGVGGGWLPGVCGGGVDGGRLRRGCSSALTPALSLTGEGVGGGGALGPALSLAGEGAGGGGALGPALSLAGEGVGGGWLPGVCGGGVDGGRLRRWYSSALTPTLSLAGEGVGGGRLAPPVLFRPHPGPLPRGRGGPDFRPHPGAVPRGRGGRRGSAGGGLWWAAVPPVLFRPHPGAVPRGGGGRRRGFVGSAPLLLRSVDFLCYSYVVSHARGHIVLCLWHPYITHGPS